MNSNKKFLYASRAGSTEGKYTIDKGLPMYKISDLETKIVGLPVSMANLTRFCGEGNFLFTAPETIQGLRVFWNTKNCLISVSGAMDADVVIR